MSEDELEQLLKREGFTVHQVDYRQTESGAAFEYKVVVSTFGLNNIKTLAGTLAGLRNILESLFEPAQNGKASKGRQPWQESPDRKSRPHTPMPSAAVNHSDAAAVSPRTVTCRQTSAPAAKA